jgi:hypothetical protein
MPWGIGVMECWNIGFDGMRSVILYEWCRAETKNRLTSVFDLQYSIFPSFHALAVGAKTLTCIAGIRE